VRGIDWQFNAWGGDYNGLYESWDKDNAFAVKFCEKEGFDYYSARHFVLEGGSIHSNGKGTILTTEECLLSKGRNPKMSKQEIENTLKEYLGGERVVWLPYGIEGDETDGHVDNICAFCDEDTVLLAWTDEEGEQNRRCKADLKVLEENGLKVIKLPLPEKPVTITEFECAGYVYTAGEDRREVGEKLAASYANFYICNAGIVVPQFGDKMDAVAVDVLKKAFKGKRVIPVFARDIIVGGGNIHCITQQVPKG
jgi:agmatine deiminase